MCNLKREKKRTICNGKTADNEFVWFLRNCASTVSNSFYIDGKKCGKIDNVMCCHCNCLLFYYCDKRDEDMDDVRYWNDTTIEWLNTAGIRVNNEYTPNVSLFTIHNIILQNREMAKQLKYIDYEINRIELLYSYRFFCFLFRFFCGEKSRRGWKP